MHQNFQSFGTPWWISGDRICSKVFDGLGDIRSRVDEAVSIASLSGITPQGEKKWQVQVGGKQDGRGKRRRKQEEW